MSSAESGNILKQWYAATLRKRMTLVTAGCSGAGKSTLIQNMLQLKHQAIQNKPSAITKEVQPYESSSVEGVIMVDMPSLSELHIDKAKVMCDLQKTTQGEVDMLLYCVSLLPDSKVDEQDKEIIKVLTESFGGKIWKHSVLVLTFANAVKKINEDQCIEKLVQHYAEEFQLVLRGIHSSCNQFSVVSIFSAIERDPSTIIALPAGYNTNEQSIRRMKWDDSIYMEVLQKCSYDSIPDFLEKSSEIVDSHLPYELRKLLDTTKQKQITLVTAGSSEAGKLTFIANMLGLTCATCIGLESQSNTSTGHVKSYARGSQIKVFDIPSTLGESDENEIDIIVELQLKNNGEADILLYCHSLGMATKEGDVMITEEDKTIIKKLTLYFGTDIWKHAILVLTHTHKLKRELSQPEFQNLIEKHAEIFQSILNGYCPPASNFSVVSTISAAHVQRSKDPCTIIVAVPVGHNRYQELEEGTKWIDSMYSEAWKKCNHNAHPPQLLRAKMPDGWFKSKGIKILLGSTVGVASGGIIGGAVGAAGGAAFAGVGAIPGAIAGAATGATSAGGLGALLGANYTLQDYQEGQSKLQKVQAAIQKINSKKNK